MADNKQSEQMIPFVTCEIPLCQDVSELVLGVDIFDLDFGIQVKFDRTANHEQLCEFWRRVSL